VVGRKVGLTSVAVQQQLGVDQPDFGVLFADMARRSGEVIATTSLLQPRIEAEVAFLIGADLGTETTDTAVRAATRSVVAALEIVDSRIAGWDISLVDTVADNASCGLFVLGTDPVELGDLDLREVTMSMIDRSGATVSLGTGADCLDDPVAAVAWLATTMKELGTPLRAGDVVLSGALGPMVAVTAGSSFRADLSGLGTVSVTFSDVVGTGVAGAAR
jgi:2-keto-4-pentenoate hydratase